MSSRIFPVSNSHLSPVHSTPVLRLPLRRLFGVSTFVAIALLGVLVACGAPEQPATPAGVSPMPAPTTAPPTATALPRGGNLTIRLAADVAELRPWHPRTRGEEQLIALLYSGLTRLDGTLAPQPDLAAGWTASADGRTITLTLRHDAVWHDGQPVTADDVVFTLNELRALEPTTALLAGLRRMTEVTAPATDTVVVRLDERYAPIFSLLTAPVLPRHALSGRSLADLNAWEAPVGSGPFRLERREPGTAITLAANQSFYRGAPLLDRVVFVVAPDAQVAASALQNGQLLLAELPWSEGRALTETMPMLQTGAYAENGYYFLAFNLRPNRIFSDLRLREALALTIDLPRMIREATNGQGMIIGNSAAPGSWADLTPPSTTTVDLDRARALLDEAGWRLPSDGVVRQKDGVTLTAQLFVRADDPRRVRAAELIAGAAEQIGMDIVVQPADFATVIRSKYAPPYDFDMLLGSWINGVADPTFGDYAYYDPDDFALFHSSQINQGVADTRPVLNFVGFSDPVYDDQAGAARQLYDLTERAQAIRRAQERVALLRPYLFLWTDRLPVACSARLTTLDGPINLATPNYLWNIERWYVTGEG
ncbi:extracellular solute-binding protein family 5 [Roseiflexus castenholzii DSM 13941]|uniref:Extracellular solute-binding protein family 5 n=1 Tax=Roseiflexus castenholzii (strain DSM 13941 / HLO8) TaxID=383372 RepID=A7NJK1_ROSCS|nr:extracellular solute-binding protein family 5 [Roseiflexus castenholzii DSM 13941]